MKGQEMCQTGTHETYFGSKLRMKYLKEPKEEKSMLT